jgi:hypothetical protein
MLPLQKLLNIQGIYTFKASDADGLIKNLIHFWILLNFYEFYYDVRIHEHKIRK